jgi:hypothetical protein
MVYVIRHPHLKTAQRGFPQLAAAVEELAIDAPHLGDVGVVRDAAAVGQHEVHGFVAGGGEEVGEFGSVHEMTFAA